MSETERDREATEQALVAAVGTVIREQGFSSLGINKVARKAGVSKVLIYRYFGSMDGLTERWLLEQNYWADNSSGAEEQIKALSGNDGAESLLQTLMVELFRGQISQLRSSPEVREMLRWFISEESPLAASVMKGVEDRGTALTAAFIRALDRGKTADPSVDREAIIALLVSGIYYLALYSDRTDRFNGVSLDSDQGWERILGAVETISERLFSQT